MREMHDRHDGHEASSAGFDASAADDFMRGHGRAGSGYPPIADYAFLSDCETMALIAPSGIIQMLVSARPKKTATALPRGDLV